jgi:hypothetical protein
MPPNSCVYRGYRELVLHPLPPTHSSVESAPMPYVNSLMRAMPSSPRSLTMSVAPNSVASFCRDAWRLLTHGLTTRAPPLVDPQHRSGHARGSDELAEGFEHLSDESLARPISHGIVLPPWTAHPQLAGDEFRPGSEHSSDQTGYDIEAGLFKVRAPCSM